MAPSEVQEKLDRQSSFKYSSLTFDKSSDTYDASYGSDSLPAICEYGKCIFYEASQRSFKVKLTPQFTNQYIYLLTDNSVTYTNWGVTSNELEPKTADECVQMCVGGTGCEVGDSGFGTWKMVACSTSLNYICEVPCKNKEFFN